MVKDPYEGFFFTEDTFAGALHVVRDHFPPHWSRHGMIKHIRDERRAWRKAQLFKARQGA